MDIQKFINIVQGHKCLWDQNEPSYHLRDQQRMAWRDISKDMEISVDELKKKWRGLRDTFGKELRKYYNKTGQAPASEPDSNWIYFKRLMFLRSIMTRRDLKSSVADTCEISYGEESGNANNFSSSPVQSTEVSEETSKESKSPLKRKVENSVADTFDISYGEENGNVNNYNPSPVQPSEPREETSKELKYLLKKKVVSYGEESGNANNYTQLQLQSSELSEETAKELKTPLKKKAKNSEADTHEISYKEESDNANTLLQVYPSEISDEIVKEFNSPLKKKTKNSIADSYEISNREESGEKVVPLELCEETPEEIKSEKKKIKRWRMNKIDARLLEIEEEKLKHFLRSANDPDAQFLMSLLPFLNDIRKDRKLTVRAKLQQVLIDEQNATTVLPD